MDITPLVPKDRLIIERYGNGGFVVNGVAHKGNILLHVGGIVPWTVTSAADMAPASFDALFAGPPPEIVLIGAGAQFVPLPPGLREYFRGKGVACDIMDTGAACRTYSVLVTEGREVAAGLIAV